MQTAGRKRSGVSRKNISFREGMELYLIFIFIPIYQGAQIAPKRPGPHLLHINEIRSFTLRSGGPWALCILNLLDFEDIFSCFSGFPRAQIYSYKIVQLS
jgi:hypothetical protein